MSGGIHRPEGKTMHRPLPIRLAPAPATEPCASCGARGHSVCSAIEDQDLARLAAVAVIREISKGDTFIQEGTPATDFFNITRGTVKLFKLLPDGRQQITGFAGVAHFLGLAVSDTYAFSAEAIEPVQLCRFSRPKLRALLHDFPAMEDRLLQRACNELVAAQEQMLLLGRKTARERVATFLVARCRDAVARGPDELVPLPMTRSEIADYLGLTIETVSRTFSRFKAEKRIATPSNSEVVILDRAWLDGMAAGHA
jgi:CRP/FNR family transcriptional regulator, anaerobic regulatory protein